MVIEEIITIGTITGKIIEIDQEAGGTIIGQVIGVVITHITTDEVMQDSSTDKIQWTSRNRSQSRNRNENYGNDHFRGRSRDRNQRRQEESRSRSNSRVSTNQYCVQCYRCREYDHFASECPNTLPDKETDYKDTDPASLQMISQDYGPVDSERDYLNL